MICCTFFYDSNSHNISLLNVYIPISAHLFLSCRSAPTSSSLAQISARRLLSHVQIHYFSPPLSTLINFFSSRFATWIELLPHWRPYFFARSSFFRISDLHRPPHASLESARPFDVAPAGALRPRSQLAPGRHFRPSVTLRVSSQCCRRRAGRLPGGRPPRLLAGKRAAAAVCRSAMRRLPFALRLRPLEAGLSASDC